MLRTNGYGVTSLRYLGGPMQGWGLRQAIPLRRLVENAQAFGEYTSIPQGYQSVARALIPAFKTSSFIRAIIQGDSSLVNTDFRIIQTLEATITGVGTLTPDMEIGATLAATVTGSGSLSADIRQVLILAATIDAGARPSAFDIAQEVWNAQASSFVSSGSFGQILGDMDAAAIADLILNDPRFLNVAKYLGLKE